MCLCVFADEAAVSIVFFGHSSVFFSSSAIVENPFPFITQNTFPITTNTNGIYLNKKAYRSCWARVRAAFSAYHLVIVFHLHVFIDIFVRFKRCGVLFFFVVIIFVLYSFILCTMSNFFSCPVCSLSFHFSWIFFFFRSIIAECLASFLYVFIVCGAAAGAGVGASVSSVLLATALSSGFVVTTLTQCFSHISGRRADTFWSGTQPFLRWLFGLVLFFLLLRLPLQPPYDGEATQARPNGIAQRHWSTKIHPNQEVCRKRTQSKYWTASAKKSNNGSKKKQPTQDRATQLAQKNSSHFMYSFFCASARSAGKRERDGFFIFFAFLFIRLFQFYSVAFNAWQNDHIADSKMNISPLHRSLDGKKTERLSVFYWDILANDNQKGKKWLCGQRKRFS